MASMVATSGSGPLIHDPVSFVTGLVAWATGLTTVISSGVASMDYGLYSTVALTASGVIVTIAIGSYSKLRRAKLALDLEESQLRRAEKLEEARNQNTVDDIQKRSLSKQVRELREALRAVELRRAESQKVNDHLISLLQTLDHRVSENHQAIKVLADSHYDLPVTLNVAVDADAATITDIEIDTIPQSFPDPVTPPFIPRKGSRKP